MAARERFRPPSAPAAAGEDAQHQCAMGTWCHAATRDAEGTWHAALTWQPFCSSCRSRIAACLEELPGGCVRMLVQIGLRPRAGKAVRVPPGPREPIRLEVDALIRETAWVLGSWPERVAAVARLSPPDTQASVAHPVEAARDAAQALHAHLDALLALPPEAMARVMYSPQAAEEWIAVTDPDEAGSVRLSGEAFMMPRLSGVNAGKEILDLHYRARKVTGEVKARPEPLDGVPCRECEDMALERAEPPSDPERPAMHSKCASCRHEMTREEYDAWVAMYRSWAEGTPGLACRRCQNGDHGQCAWGRCACRAREHAVAA
jgi:hypothetical protein